MSKQIKIINDIEVTEYCGQNKKLNYQVTWVDREFNYQWCAFYNKKDALEFTKLLNKAIER